MNVSLPDGTPLHVEDRGRGLPVLFVHGFPLNHAMWQGQIEELSQSCRTIAVDLRGFGGSGGAEADLLTMDRFADDLHALLAAMEIAEPVIFCGLSMGGYVAFRFVEKHADRLRGLILCDTRPGADNEEGVKNRRQLAEKVLRSGPEFAVAAMLPKLVSEKTNAERPQVIEQLRQMILQTDRSSIAAASLGMAQRPDSTPLLPRIAAPALVLCGREDTLTPPNVMRDMAGRMPHSQFVEIPQAGHMAPLEDPPAVNAAIREFLQAVTG